MAYERRSSGPSRREGRPRYFNRRKVCSFCANKVETIQYKDVNLLRRFLSERAKIEGTRRTGTCPTHQRALATALMRARHLALLPYTADHIYLMGGAAR